MRLDGSLSLGSSACVNSFVDEREGFGCFSGRAAQLYGDHPAELPADGRADDELEFTEAGAPQQLGAQALRNECGKEHVGVEDGLYEIAFRASSSVTMPVFLALLPSFLCVSRSFASQR